MSGVVLGDHRDELVRKGKRKWNEATLDLSQLNSLADLAKAYDGCQVPSVPDLEKLLEYLIQQDGLMLGGGGGVGDGGEYGAVGAGGGNGGDEGRGKRQVRPKKGYEWELVPDESGGGGGSYGQGEGGGGDADANRSFYGRATKGYQSRAPGSNNGGADFGPRPLDLPRAEAWFRALSRLAPQDFPQIAIILEAALAQYKARAIDHVALASIVRVALKDHTELQRDFFALTSPDDSHACQRGKLDDQPTWAITREELRRAPLSKKVPLERPVAAGHGANFIARAEQASRILNSGPPEDFAKHFLVRARLEMGEYYPWLLDNLVSMRLSLRANQFAALEKRASTVLKSLPDSLKRDFVACFPISLPVPIMGAGAAVKRGK